MMGPSVVICFEWNSENIFSADRNGENATFELVRAQTSVKVHIWHGNVSAIRHCIVLFGRISEMKIIVSEFGRINGLWRLSRAFQKPKMEQNPAESVVAAAIVQLGDGQLVFIGQVPASISGSVKLSHSQIVSAPTA